MRRQGRRNPEESRGCSDRARRVRRPTRTWEPQLGTNVRSPSQGGGGRGRGGWTPPPCSLPRPYASAQLQETRADEQGAPTRGAARCTLKAARQRPHTSADVYDKQNQPTLDSFRSRCDCSVREPLSEGGSREMMNVETSAESISSPMARLVVVEAPRGTGARLLPESTRVTEGVGRGTVERWLVAGTRWCIRTEATFVSLNYDILLEEALRRKNPEYLVADWAVHKPHGSVDWCAAGSTLGSGSEWAELSPRGMEFQEVFRGNIPPHRMKGTPGWPAIAHYGRFKPADVNPDYVQRARGRAARAAARPQQG